ncbi:MAG TPA: outer membrane protein assembly factor BamA [Phycisphaerae bacterium]|jgi:outer membrane protein insertion porin family
MPRPILCRYFPTALRAGLLVLLMAALWTRTAPAQTAPAGGGGSGVQVFGGAGQGPVALEGLPILRVEIKGNTRTDTQLILDQIRSQQGQAYSLALVDVDNKSIAALDKFVTTRAEVEPVAGDGPPPRTYKGVIVRFIVEERALVTGVEIAGNRKFNNEQIRDGLTVRPGAAVDAFRIETDRKNIVDLYKKKGYAQASVDVDQGLLNKEGIVRYQIIEGPATAISKIEFDGNSVLSAAYIKWRIQTKTNLWIFRKGILDEEKLQADVSAIRDMYLKKAYLDVRVSYVLEYTEDKSKLTVRFVIIEGMHYRIGKMTVDGNTVFGERELLGDTSRFGPGSYAERDKLDALRKRVEDAYGHEGYIYREVDVQPAYTDTPGIVDITIKVTEGKPYIVGRVIVRGNGNIQDRVIRRQIRIYPDQTFDMVLVRKSIERLQATRMLQDVKITGIPPQDNAAGVRDALVEVAEGQTGKFSFGAGISTNSGLVGQISVEQQNFDITATPRSLDEYLRGQSFKGAGQYFQLLLEPGTEFQRYIVRFREPYLFDSPYSFSSDLYYFTRSRESWDERRIGLNVAFGRRFGDVWAVSVALRAEEVSLSHAQDLFNDGITQANFPVVGPDGSIIRANDTAQEILNEIGSHFLTSIKPAVVRDTTDSATFPTSGTRTALSLEQYGALGGEVDITKVEFSFNWYYTLYTDLFDRKTVLSIRNEAGIIPVGTSPTYERFYLGGTGDLRGFKFRGVSPRSGPRSDPIGGDTYWATTAEVNFPVYEDFLRGVVFLDTGTVEKDITIGSIRADFGVGIRVNLPFFSQPIPVAIDFGYPVLKKSGDLTQLISVSLGAGF